MALDPLDFAGFFQDIHGDRPFPWQQDLVDTLARGDAWPDVLDLPTGAGKTAALDAAVFHLALRADAPGRAALRIALVVDRRLVVDDTFARAQKIAKALCLSSSGDAGGGAVVAEVARRLKRLAGEKNPPLVSQRLRGGAPLEHDWARTPTQPTILCSTVDQVGSRLLFRGYGVSDRMKPVHAGLLGVDSLILLDEAHLSEPFRQTLDAVRKLGQAKLSVALLSATPGAKAERAFTLSVRDRADPELGKRLKAKKPAAMIELPVSAQTETVAKTFANEARALMGRLRGQGVSPSAVGVIVNRVALARAIHSELAKAPAEGDGPDARDTDAVLLIGPSRSVDRDEAADTLAPFRTGADCGRGAHATSLFVVATQCLEVGVDLDLDGLVTQAASLDALRQRFGRLNRAGRPVRTEGTVLARAEDIKTADDPVYGDRIRTTWKALNELADDGKVDFGVEALPARLEKAGIEPSGLAAERPNAPVVMPAYLDLWSQTSPRPAADPDVSLFLHGAERTSAGVSIVWRGDISASDLTGSEENGTDLKELLRLVPPRTAEAIEVPLWVARGWLNRVEGVLANISDSPERKAEARRTAGNRRPRRRALRWAGPDDPRTGAVEADELRMGDMLVVPSAYGGCDQFGWAPDSADSVADVADKAAEPYWGRRCAIRVTRDIVRRDDQWSRVSAALVSEGAAAGDLVDALIEVLPALEEEAGDGGDGPNPRDVRKSLSALLQPKGRIDVHCPYAGGRAGGAVLVAERGIEHADAADDAGVSATEDESASHTRCRKSCICGLPQVPATEDESASHTSAKPVHLDDHGRRVARLAKRFARTLGLEDAAKDLGLAAFLHDAGKADPRFQVMLSGGDPWNRPDGPPLAKSGRSWSPGAWARAQLPEGWRHEALSVRMARMHPRLAQANDPSLVLWLIGSHHGLGRPFFGFLDSRPEQPLPCLDVADWQLPEDQPGPHSLAFDLDGADWPSLFEGLKHRYGIWGLAHLEAILRLADHRASEEERAS